MVTAFTFIGVSGSGKTRLLTRVIEVLRQRGRRVAAIKHTHHRFEFDCEGKDSFRMKQAGAEAVVLVSAEKLGLVTETREPLALEEVLERYLADYDIVLVEGFHRSEVPKILVCRNQSGRGPMLPPFDWRADAVALVTDSPELAADFPDAPLFGFDDVGAIADFLERWKVGIRESCRAAL